MTVDVHALGRDGLVAFGAGLGLGLVYFGGLWWTSRRIARAAWPQAFYFVSFALRMALLLGGIWLVTGGRAATTALCLVGVLVGRRLTVAYVQRSAVAGEEREGTARYRSGDEPDTGGADGSSDR